MIFVWLEALLACLPVEVVTRREVADVEMARLAPGELVTAWVVDPEVAS